MQNPTTEGLSLSMFESQYDAYLLMVRGRSRSTRSLHHHEPTGRKVGVLRNKFAGPGHSDPDRAPEGAPSRSA